jgi:hypothetical protein
MISPPLLQPIQTRARAWLLFSFLLAIASVGGSIAVLISTSQAQQFTAIGVVGAFRTCSLFSLALGKQTFYVFYNLLFNCAGFCDAMRSHSSFFTSLLGI